MSDARPPRTHAPSRNTWIVIYLLLAPAVVLPLWVSLYDRTDPTLFGFPFFFWFQFALILIAVSLTVPAYLLTREAERLDRVRYGLTPEPQEDEPEGDGR